MDSDAEITDGFRKRVTELEDALKLFRAEVDMKMKIVEQVLLRRSEQLISHKKLLDREQVLCDSVLDHWKNIADLATNGLSLHFSQDEPSCPNPDVKVDVTLREEEGSVTEFKTMNSSRKRSSAAARRERSKLQKKKIALADTGAKVGYDEEDHSYKDEVIQYCERDGDSDNLYQSSDSDSEEVDSEWEKSVKRASRTASRRAAKPDPDEIIVSHSNTLCNMRISSQTKKWMSRLEPFFLFYSSRKDVRGRYTIKMKCQECKDTKNEDKTISGVGIGNFERHLEVKHKEQYFQYIQQNRDSK